MTSNCLKCEPQFMSAFNQNIRSWLELARSSNLPTVWTNILAAWLLAGGKWDWHPLAWLLIGGSLIYTGGMILNDAADVKFDREFRKERPLPSGRVSVVAAWCVGTGCLVAGFVTMVWGAESCIWLTGSLVVAAVAYDLYHKPWAGSILIMGSCRTLLYLTAASAVTGSLNWESHHEVIIKAIALGGYVVGLSLVARHESTAAKPDRYIFIGSLLMLGSPIYSGVTYSLIYGHPGHGLFMCAGLSLFLWVVVKKLKSDPPRTIGPAVAGLLAGIVLVDATAVSSVSITATVALACMLPMALLWQRVIAAT